MSFISRSLKQKAVYWPYSSVNTYGRPTWGTAVEIWCRWEDKSVEYIASDNTRKLSIAIVYTKSDVIPAGVLWLGKLTGLTSLTEPKSNPGAFEIMRFDKSPDLNKREYIRKAYL